MAGTVATVCVSEARGTPKRPVERGRLIAGHGLEGDAHAGDWHRQVSLLSLDKIDRFNAAGGDVADGDFGENIVVAGIDLAKLPVGARLRVGGAVLEVTQIGKECHSRCQIYHRAGDCIMPREERLPHPERPLAGIQVEKPLPWDRPDRFCAVPSDL